MTDLYFNLDCILELALLMSPTCNYGSYLENFMHLRCAVLCYSVRNFIMKLSKLEFMYKLQRYLIRMVFDELVNYDTMDSYTSRVNQNCLPNTAIIWTIYVSSMREMFQAYPGILSLCIRGSWVPLSYLWILYVLLRK